MFPGTKGRNLMNPRNSGRIRNILFWLFDEVSDNTEGLRPEEYGAEEASAAHARVTTSFKNTAWE